MDDKEGNGRETGGIQGGVRGRRQEKDGSRGYREEAEVRQREVHRGLRGEAEVGGDRGETMLYIERM